jgi:hypothetical protein
MTESLQDCAARIARDEIRANVSALVATLAGGAGSLEPLLNQELPDLRRLTDLADQALELAAPVDDWEEAARQAGWSMEWPCVWIRMATEAEILKYGKGDGFTHALSAQAACEHDKLAPYRWEVYEHWAVSQWFGEKLAAKGEKVDFDFAGLVVWARSKAPGAKRQGPRTNTGQSIEIDSVIEAISAGIVAASRE